MIRIPKNGDVFIIFRYFYFIYIITTELPYFICNFATEKKVIIDLYETI